MTRGWRLLLFLPWAFMGVSLSAAQSSLKEFSFTVSKYRLSPGGHLLVGDFLTDLPALIAHIRPEERQIELLQWKDHTGLLPLGNAMPLPAIEKPLSSLDWQGDRLEEIVFIKQDKHRQDNHRLQIYSPAQQQLLVNLPLPNEITIRDMQSALIDEDASADLLLLGTENEVLLLLSSFRIIATAEPLVRYDPENHRLCSLEQKQCVAVDSATELARGGAVLRLQYQAGTLFLPPQISRFFSNSPQLHPHAWYSHDIDGDARADFLWINQQQQEMIIQQSNASYATRIRRILPPFAKNESILFGDLDADGQRDIIMPPGSGSYFWLGQRAGTEVLPFEMEVGLPWRRANDPILVGDLNGDAQVELLHYRGETGELSIAKNISQPVSKRHALLTRDGPQPCVSYINNRHNPWGRIYPVEHCPAGHAVMGNDDLADSDEKAGRQHYALDCCPLPAADILTEEHLLAAGSCPEHFVVTGLERSSENPQATLLRCTKINLERYRLGAELPGRYWGTGLSLLDAADWVGKNRIPATLRFGLGRLGFYEWDPDGCVGEQFGSLLVSVGGADCSEWRYRQLYTVQKSTQPLQVIPECRSTIDPYFPYPHCAH